MNKVAKIMDVPPMKVYQVATFYTMFNRQWVGKYHLQVCGTTPCMIRGTPEIMKTIEDHVGIRDGETSECGTFTVQEVECLGACVNAPMMQVNNEWFYEDLTPENTRELLDAMKNGGELNPGPQIEGWINSEGVEGRSTLIDYHQQPETRDFAAAKVEWEKKKEEAAQKK